MCSNKQTAFLKVNVLHVISNSKLSLKSEIEGQSRTAFKFDTLHIAQSSFVAEL